MAAIVLAVLGAAATALLPAPAKAGDLPSATAIYGIASDNNIYAIDPGTGQVTGTVSTSSLTLSGSLANAFALDRDRAQIYFLSSDKNLYYWALNSGTGGQIATAAELGLATAAIPRNATYFSDRFWFVGETDNLLRSATISRDLISGLPTAAALQSPLTISGPTGILNPNDIAYDPDTNLGYGSALDGTFFQIDMATLGSGTVAYTALYTPDPLVGVQLAFDKDYATLYGQDYQTGQWYTMSTAVGGNATPVSGAVTPAEFRMRDLAGGVQAVPEPGTMALAGSGIVIAGVSAWRRRRRRCRDAWSRVAV